MNDAIILRVKSLEDQVDAIGKAYLTDHLEVLALQKHITKIETKLNAIANKVNKHCLYGDVCPHTGGK